MQNTISSYQRGGALAGMRVDKTKETALYLLQPPPPYREKNRGYLLYYYQLFYTD
jgi:hypothetical protein